MEEPPDLEEWIARIRSRDAMTFEDAYEGPRPTGPGVLAMLVKELHAAADGYTRGKFAELLGEMGDASVVAVLIAELAHPEKDARTWAVLALEQLGIPDGLNAAQRYRAEHPGDFA
jgi:HEAT repeat protein